MENARSTHSIRTWFITGTSAGFGRELTQQLLRRGDRVAATLRKPAALDGLKSTYGEKLWVEALDITDTDAVRRVIGKAFADLGRIDVVVNNAAYGLVGAAEELIDEQIRRQIDTNVVGSIQVIRAALPHLRAQGGGRILQLSSEGGQITYPGFSLYHTTKWAIEGFVEAVAQEVAPFNIEFTIIEPGPSRTSFGRGLVTAPPMAEYENTPAGDVRRAIADGAFPVPGDPVEIVRRMIECVDSNPAPRRLALGRGAYARIRAVLTDRIAALDAQKDVALSTDFEACAL